MTKNYRVKLAFENYRVGQVIQPTGLWRGRLLSRGYIEPVAEGSEAPAQDSGAGAESGGLAERVKQRRGRPRKENQSVSESV